MDAVVSRKGVGQVRRPTRASRVLPAAVAAAIAAGCYAAIRLPDAFRIHASFAKLCAKFAMQPADWPCQVTDSRAVAMYVCASLLTGLALALPAAVLAASGRRLGFLVVFAIPGISFLWAATATGVSALMGLVTGVQNASFSVPPIPYLGVHPWLTPFSSPSFWDTHALIGAAIDTLLLATPATLIAVRSRNRGRPPRPSLPSAHTLLALGIAGATAGLVVTLAWWTHLLRSTSFIDVGNAPGYATAFVAMFVFGALLRREAQWWPWIFGPVAFLMSLAPATALRGSLSQFDDLSGFGAVLPLAAVGLIASEWDRLERPVARALARRRAKRLDDELDDEESVSDPEPEPARVEAPAGPRRPPAIGRGTVMVGLATGTLAVTTIMFAFNPLGVQLATALPTYLGERVAAQDLRARLDLNEALGAARAYLAANGALTGFDGADGRRLAPSLHWRQGAFAAHPKALTAAVASPPLSRRLALLAVSDSGRVFALSVAAGGSATFGFAGGGDGSTSALLTDQTLALRASGNEPWGDRVLRGPPVATMCRYADPQTIVICRAVQRLIRHTLRGQSP